MLGDGGGVGAAAVSPALTYGWKSNFQRILTRDLIEAALCAVGGQRQLAVAVTQGIRYGRGALRRFD